MKFQIFIIFALFLSINGFTVGDRKVRAVDFQTDQLEEKLLRSNLQTFNGRNNGGLSISQNEQVAYGLASTFVFKSQAGVGQNVIRNNPANNAPRVVNAPQPRSSLERE